MEVRRQTVSDPDFEEHEDLQAMQKAPGMFFFIQARFPSASSFSQFIRALKDREYVEPQFSSACRTGSFFPSGTTSGTFVNGQGS